LPAATAYWRSGRVKIPRRGVGGLHLPEDLRLADDERIEAGRHAKQMPRRVDAAMDVQMIVEHGRRDVVVVAEEPRQRAGRRVRLADGVDLRAIAGREHDRFRDNPRGRDRGHRALNAVAREVDGLPQLDGRRPVTEASDKEARHLYD
jgi:hypothetical protein